MGFLDKLKGKSAKPTAATVAPAHSTPVAAPARPAVVAPAPSSANAVILAPVTGKVVPLAEVPDPVFAGGMMGDGVAIIPTEGKLVAPFAGEVSAIFPTGHAVGLKSDTGVEVLLHLGVDTVKLEGKGFTAHVKEGQHVAAGAPLVDFDIPTITGAGYSMATPVIITNGDDLGPITKLATTGPITAGQPLMQVAAK